MTCRRRLAFAATIILCLVALAVVTPRLMVASYRRSVTPAPVTAIAAYRDAYNGSETLHAVARALVHDRPMLGAIFNGRFTAVGGGGSILTSTDAAPMTGTGRHSRRPVAIAARADGNGVWLAMSDGQVIDRSPPP